MNHEMALVCVMQATCRLLEHDDPAEGGRGGVDVLEHFSKAETLLVAFSMVGGLGRGGRGLLQWKVGLQDGRRRQ